MAGHDSLAVANYFIEKAAQEDSSVTPMQLLKLVYIAHGWNLAVNDEPLISDPIEAWKYGPVIPRVYHAFKKFGRHKVQSFALKSDAAAVFFPEDIDDEPIQSDFDEKERQLVDIVWDLYKKFDGLKLSQLTHLKDTPWDQVYRNGIGSLRIANDIIQKYYKDLAQQRMASAS